MKASKPFKPMATASIEFITITNTMHRPDRFMWNIVIAPL